jgi:hypothetical protein
MTAPTAICIGSKLMWSAYNAHIIARFTPIAGGLFTCRSHHSFHSHPLAGFMAAKPYGCHLWIRVFIMMFVAPSPRVLWHYYRRQATSSSTSVTPHHNCGEQDPEQDTHGARPSCSLTCRLQASGFCSDHHEMTKNAASSFMM